MSTKIETGIYTVPHATVDGMRQDDGKRLKALLDTTRYSQTDLANACGVTRMAVGRWVGTKSFSPRMLKTIIPGLKKLGLDPRELGLDMSTELDVSGTEDLTKLVEDWPREHFPVLRRILESNYPSRQHLHAYVLGVLRA